MLASGKVSQESESWTGEDVMYWWEVMTECDKCHPGVTPRDTVMMSHTLQLQHLGVASALH